MRKTLNISFPEETLDFIRRRAREEYYSSVSEYTRSLIRQDQRNNKPPEKPYRKLRTANDAMRSSFE